MKDEYTFKYNAFGNVLLLLVLVAGTFMVLVFGTLLVALAVIAAEGILFYFLCQRTYLTIDSEGIRLTNLGCSSEFLPWNRVGGYCKDVTMGSGKNAVNGIGILWKGYSTSDDLDQYDSGIHAMFINKDLFRATTDEVTKALDDSIDRYVNGNQRTKRRDRTLAGWDTPAATQRKVSTVLWLLFVLWVLAFDYTTYTSMRIILGDHAQLVSMTLTNVWDYEIFLLPFFTVAFSAFYILPKLIVKSHYVFSTIGLLTALVITIGLHYKIIPAMQLVYANCTEPTQSEVECVEGVISRINSGKNSYTAYHFIYENVTYDFHERHLTKARRGMGVKVYIRKGSRGIPIVQDIEIPAIGWSLTKGYYAPEEQHAAKQRMTETVKKVTHNQKSPSKYHNPSSKTDHATDTWSKAYPWKLKPLIIKGNEMGVWKLLAPEWPQHHFYSHYLSMHIAIQEDDGKAMLLFYDEMNSKYYPANIRSVVTVETDGLTNRYQVAPDNYLSGTVWLFGSNDARKFIKQVANSPHFTINCTSKEDNTVKAYTFIVSQDKKSE